MLFTAAAAALFALGANARITGIGCPEVVRPGEPFKAVILTDSYEESVTDVSLSFGFGNRDHHRYNDYAPYQLGGYADSFYFNERFEKKEKFEREVIIPNKGLDYGDGRISASLYSLYGDNYYPEIHDFFVDVRFGEEISDKYVYSHY